MKSKTDYFFLFTRQSAFCVDAAEILQKILADFDPFLLPETVEKIHAVEKEADAVRKGLTERLYREFLPPIEREDILALANELDNVTDAVEDTLRHLYMYNMDSAMEDAVHLSGVVLESCRALHKAVMAFRDFKKPGKLPPFLQKIHALEEESDEVYTKAVRNLYCGTNDPRQLLRWQDLYSNLESCCDTCAHAAEVMEAVMFKNA